MPPSRRKFLESTALLTAGCGASGESNLADAFRGGSHGGLQDRPDIIFICIDDLNDWPTPFIGPKPTFDPNDIITPNMMQLAQMGTVFQRAYCEAPICGASRSATLTGLPPHVSGVTENECILNPDLRFGPLLVDDFTTLPRELQAAGYRNLGVGKMFHDGGYYGKPGSYDADSWDEYYTSIGRHTPQCDHLFEDAAGVDDEIQPCPDEELLLLPDAEVANFALDKLGEPPDSSPMFLAVGFFKPHAPWEVAQSYFDMYPYHPKGVIKSIVSSVERDDQNDLTLSGCTSLRDLKHSPSDGLTQAEWEERSRAAIAGYLACITQTDYLLGEVVKAAAQRQRRTVFILWSDHGYFMGEKRGWKKPKLYERASRVPLIIVDTATMSPQSTDTIVSLGDLFPTVLDYAGLPNPTPHGKSLRPLVEDSNAPWDRTSVVTTMNFRGDHRVGDPDLERCMAERGITICGVCPDDPYGGRMRGASHALRTQRPGQEYRYIRYRINDVFEAPGGVPYRELYDLATDPFERVNLLAPENTNKPIEELADELDAELEQKLA